MCIKIPNIKTNLVVYGLFLFFQFWFGFAHFNLTQICVICIDKAFPLTDAVSVRLCKSATLDDWRQRKIKFETIHELWTQPGENKNLGNFFYKWVAYDIDKQETASGVIHLILHYHFLF